MLQRIASTSSDEKTKWTSRSHVRTIVAQQATSTKMSVNSNIKSEENPKYLGHMILYCIVFHIHISLSFNAIHDLPIKVILVHCWEDSIVNLQLRWPYVLDVSGQSRIVM